MSFVKEYFIPIAWILVGMAILTSPEGRILQMQISFGEYKHIVGSGFIVVGSIFSLMIIRKKME